MSEISKIYILDDNQEFLDYFSLYLKKFNYDVDVFLEEEPLIEQLVTQLPDICFVDINLKSSGSGFETIKRIKSVQKGSPLILIALSARQDYDSLAYALELGVTDYVVKPLDPGRIINKLFQYSQGHRDSHFINETKISVAATASLSLKVLELNEFGLKFSSEHLILRDTCFKLKCGFFDTIFPDGILVNIIKTSIDEPQLGRNRSFIHEARFSNLNDETLGLIRQFINF